MIDTVALTLKLNMFTVFEPDKFSPSARGLLDNSYRLGGRANMRCVQNPTPRELKSGIYKPRLTLTRRMTRTGYEITLRVEFSAPKLLFNNNFDELEDDDFYDAVILLAKKLNEMGVQVSEYNVATAPVSVVHFPKNIPLTDGSTPYMYLKEIQKSKISKRMDFNQTDFRNEGHSFKYRTNSFEVAFYDKLKDLEKAKISEKRSEEKDNAIQFNLFEELPVRKVFELLRMEVRLNQRQKIKQILRKIDKKIEPTFNNIFNKDVSQKVLLHFLNEIEDNYPKMLYFNPKSYKDFIAQFIVDNPEAKLKDVVTALGSYFVLEEIGTRETRELLKKYPTSSWYSFMKHINGFNYTKNKLSPFEIIRTTIEEFKTVKLIDFQEEMLNNDKNN